MTKDDGEFFIRPDRKDVVLSSACKECVRKQSKESQRVLRESTNVSPEKQFRLAIYRLIDHARVNAKKREIEFGLGVPFLRELYKKQDGKCYYTGTPMLIKQTISMDPFRISIDKIDSSKGYTEDNVVLCCWGVNALKGKHSGTMLYECIRQFYENSKICGKF